VPGPSGAGANLRKVFADLHLARNRNGRLQITMQAEDAHEQAETDQIGPYPGPNQQQNDARSASRSGTVAFRVK